MKDTTAKVNEKIKQVAYDHDKLLKISTDFLKNQSGYELMSRAVVLQEKLEKELGKSMLPSVILAGILTSLTIEVLRDYKNEKRFIDFTKVFEEYLDKNFERKKPEECTGGPSCKHEVNSENWKGNPK